MNVVVSHSGKFLEIQGTAERGSFTKDQVMKIMDLASEALKPVFQAQNLALDGQTAEI
jgi:ribonuclease PH